MSVPYDDALLLCRSLRLVEGSVSYGIHVAEAENRESNAHETDVVDETQSVRDEEKGGHGAAECEVLAHGGFFCCSLHWYFCLSSSV